MSFVVFGVQCACTGFSGTVRLRLSEADVTVDGVSIRTGFNR